MSWLYRIFSVQAVSNLIGTIEIAVAALLKPLGTSRLSCNERNILFRAFGIAPGNRSKR